MKRTAIAAGALALAAGLVAVPVGAAVDDPIKVRQAVMRSQGVHLGALGAIAKGEVPWTPLAEAHAFAIVSFSAVIPSLFPEGSVAGDTGAKPEIWMEWSKFEQAAANLNAAATKLVEAAKGGDPAAIGAALGEVGGGCGGCHKPFRKPQN